MTWILPNNLSDTYPSVLDLKELGLDSDEFSQVSEKSLMWRSKHSPSRIWSRRLKRESWIQRLSTRMLRASHSDSFVERWTSSLEDSPASLSVLLGTNREQTMNDTSTHSSAQGSGSASQQLSFLKMFLVSSAQNSPAEKVFSNMSLETWNRWVTQQRQESLARKRFAHLIEETGYSSWPTPRAVDARSANQPHKDRGVKPIAHLNAAVKQENWTTPTQDTSERSKNYAQGGTPLSKQVNQENWGTPTSRDWKGPSSGSIIRNDGKSRMDQLVYQVEQPQHGPPAPDTSSTNGKSHGQSWSTPNANDHREATGMRPSRIETNRKTEYLHRQVNTTTGKLNPNWVEQLMGLTVGWTQLSSAWREST